MSDSRRVAQTWQKTSGDYGQLGEGVNFEYPTKHPEALSRETMMIEAWDKNTFQDEKIGDVSIDLFSLASGPSDLKFKINRDASMDFVGTLELSLKMQQTSEVVYPCRTVRISLHDQASGEVVRSTAKDKALLRAANTV